MQSSVTARQTEHMVEIPGHGVTCVRDHAGPEGAPVLLLLHGLGATAALNWGRCYPALTRHFRVLSLDHRGHGRGLRTRRFRLEECADDAVAAAEALGVEEFISVGYSMGGPIASLTWRRHPDRVRGLVLCATARHFASRSLSRLARASLPAAAMALRLVPSLIHREATHRMLQSIEHPELREHIRTELLGHDPASIVQATEAVTRFSSHDWIGQVDVPTAVIVTTLDELVPASRQYKLAESIPGAECIEVEADHDACVASPDFGSSLVRACVSVHQRRVLDVGAASASRDRGPDRSRPGFRTSA
ncbi:MAG: alpha/beta fold hydrolase [Myxococcota bacterium]|nr:alpha/beta fold hydrolase [Myxococcota bacterium]